MRSQFPKKCTLCPRVHDQKSWAQLEYVGTTRDDIEELELRNCPCGTTLAVAVQTFATECASCFCALPPQHGDPLCRSCASYEEGVERGVDEELSR